MRKDLPARAILGLLLASSLVAACDREPGEVPAAEKALAELSEKYAELRDKYEQLDKGEEAVAWAREDLGKIGDWEYKIVVVTDGDDAGLEAQLNELGNERWEVFWMERSGSGLRLMLKRPAISYISKMPFSYFGGAIGDGE